MKVQIIEEKAEEGRPLSIERYYKKIKENLSGSGVQFIETTFGADVVDGVDIVWAPGLGNRRVPPAVFDCPVPAVVTIHGLQHINAPPLFRQHGFIKGLGHFVWRLKIRRDWWHLRNKGVHVISVSQTLREQINKRILVPRENITVIPHGVDAAAGNFETAALGELILHVSQYSSVKNIERIILAYDRVRDLVRLPLLILSVGYPGSRCTLPEGVTIRTVKAEHAEVIELMRRARVFMFPSLEESFGLPVLEAMSCGVPVVTSEGTGAGEVASGAAILVDPHDIDQIATALLRAATDPAEHAMLRAAGLRRAAEMTWDRCADRHLKLFHDLCGALSG